MDQAGSRRALDVPASCFLFIPFPPSPAAAWREGGLYKRWLPLHVSAGRLGLTEFSFRDKGYALDFALANGYQLE